MDGSGAQSTPVVSGYCKDVFVKRLGGWKIKSRTLLQGPDNAVVAARVPRRLDLSRGWKFCDPTPEARDARRNASTARVAPRVAWRRSGKA